jgi:uncharacterized DUF497 family protein
MALGFEWNAAKAATNQQKHGIDFVEAASVFNDPLAQIFLDERDSGELREIVIGHSSRRRLLLVCFTEPANERIRIISARSATRREQSDYEEHTSN